MMFFFLDLLLREKKRRPLLLISQLKKKETPYPCQFESIGRTPISIRKKKWGSKKGYPPLF